MNRMNDEIRRDTRKDPEQLEREIDATRTRLQQTLEELEHRLSPSELFDRIWSQTRHHGGELAGNLGHSLKENPWPALLTSVGIAWMMATNGRHHYDESADESAVGRSGERMRRKLGGAREAMRRGRGALREGFAGAHDTASAMREQGHDMAVSARHRARQMRAGLGELLEEQPLILGAIGLAAGAIAGAMMPPTEQEDRMLGPARDRALERAKSAGAEGARQVRERGEEAARAAKDAMGESRDEGGERSEQPGDPRSAPQMPEPPTRPSSPGTGLGY